MNGGNNRFYQTTGCSERCCRTSFARVVSRGDGGTENLSDKNTFLRTGRIVIINKCFYFKGRENRSKRFSNCFYSYKKIYLKHFISHLLHFSRVLVSLKETSHNCLIFCGFRFAIAFVRKIIYTKSHKVRFFICLLIMIDFGAKFTFQIHIIAYFLFI